MEQVIIICKILMVMETLTIKKSGDTNPYIGKPELEEVYDVDTTVKGKVFIHELAGTGHKAQLVDKEGTVLAEKLSLQMKKMGLQFQIL